jgi:hypothetical protein
MKQPAASTSCIYDVAEKCLNQPRSVQWAASAATGGLQSLGQQPQAASWPAAAACRTAVDSRRALVPTRRPRTAMTTPHCQGISPPCIMHAFNESSRQLSAPRTTAAPCMAGEFYTCTPMSDPTWSPASPPSLHSSSTHLHAVATKVSSLFIFDMDHVSVKSLPSEYDACTWTYRKRCCLTCVPSLHNN